MVSKKNIEIKVSEVVFYLYIIFGLVAFAISPLAYRDDVKMLPLYIIIIGIASIFRAFYLKSARIYITDMDVKYTSWFHRKAIKTVESFNSTGIWIFNSVVFTGRGRSTIKMSNVEDLDKVRKLIESIDHLKAKN